MKEQRSATSDVTTCTWLRSASWSWSGRRANSQASLLHAGNNDRAAQCCTMAPCHAVRQNHTSLEERVANQRPAGLPMVVTIPSGQRHHGQISTRQRNAASRSRISRHATHLQVHSWKASLGSFRGQPRNPQSTTIVELKDKAWSLCGPPVDRCQLVQPVLIRGPMGWEASLALQLWMVLDELSSWVLLGGNGSDSAFGFLADALAFETTLDLRGTPVPLGGLHHSLAGCLPPQARPVCSTTEQRWRPSQSPSALLQVPTLKFVRNKAPDFMV